MFPQPTTTLPVEDVFENSEYIRNYFNGIYRVMRTSASGHDSGGFSSILLSRAVSGNDVLRTVFSWFIFEYNYLARTIPSGRKNSFMWGLFYGIIDQTNLILEQLPLREQPKLPEAQLSFTRENIQFKAEASGYTCLYVLLICFKNLLLLI